MGSAIEFLCVNELGLRGTEETLRHNVAGDDVALRLFLKLMEDALEKDEKLASTAKCKIMQNTHLRILKIK